MTQKLNVVLIVLTVVFLLINVLQFVSNKKEVDKLSAEKASAVAECDNLKAEFASGSVWTVSKPVKAGEKITSSMLHQTQIPRKYIVGAYITDESDIIGRLFKIAINPGTIITENMTMVEDVEDSMRDRDIILDRWTVGLKEGDYVDVRMTMPYGDDYVVLSHKRVYYIGADVLKMHLTEAEWLRYQGAMIDYYLNHDYGCTIYADKYIEPGLQAEAVKYYAVPTNIAALIEKDPNILDDVTTEQRELNTWRNSIEELLVIFRDEDDTVDTDGSKFAAGRDAYNSSVKSGATKKAQDDAKNPPEEESVEEEESFDFGDGEGEGEEAPAEDTLEPAE